MRSHLTNLASLLINLTWIALTRLTQWAYDRIVQALNWLYDHKEALRNWISAYRGVDWFIDVFFARIYLNFIRDFIVDRALDLVDSAFELALIPVRHIYFFFAEHYVWQRGTWDWVIWIYDAEMHLWYLANDVGGWIDEEINRIVQFYYAVIWPIINSIVERINQVVRDISAFIEQQISNIYNFFVALLGNLQAFVIQQLSNITQFVNSAIDNLNRWITDRINEQVARINELTNIVIRLIEWYNAVATEINMFVADPTEYIHSKLFKNLWPKVEAWLISLWDGV